MKLQLQGPSLHVAPSKTLDLIFKIVYNCVLHFLKRDPKTARASGYTKLGLPSAPTSPAPYAHLLIFVATFSSSHLVCDLPSSPPSSTAALSAVHGTRADSCRRICATLLLVLMPASVY